ncbi:MAG: CHC2 zinc finger domain-containing protein [Methylococcaceae bacterium]
MSSVTTTRRHNRGGGKTKQGRKPTSDSIKNSISPLDFYRHELPGAPLKRQGWNDGGLCPFHADNTPGSFMVNTDTGSFVCFSCGVKGGDIISFTMLRHALDFVEALKSLACDWGLL